MRFLVRCGPGLEDLAIKELEQKIPEATTISNPFGLRGYVQLEKILLKEQIPEIFKQIHSLRCFERIGVILTSQSVSGKILDSQLHALCEETFDIMRTDSEFQTFNQAFNPQFTLSNYPICINAEIEFQQRIQRIAKLIGNRKNLQIDHTIRKSKEGFEPLNIYFRQNRGCILTYWEIPLHPGNFHLHQLHPTGLFPNFIYAMGTLTFDAMTSASQSEMIIADPFMGTGGILVFIASEWKSSSQNILDHRSLRFVGIESNSQFYGRAEYNLKDISEKQLILSDFQNVTINQLRYGLCHAIITQPPYGYSIPQSDDALRKLYSDLVKWAGIVLQPLGILSLITSRGDILTEILNTAKFDTPDLEWIPIHIRSVQQHSIEAKIFILRKEIVKPLISKPDVLRKKTKKSSKKSK